MASTTPRVPEQLRATIITRAANFHVDEVAADVAGPVSPYGPEMQFPLPLEELRYRHPGPESRPNLAEGR